VAVAEEIVEVAQPDELRLQPECVLQLERVPDRLAAGQKKKMIVIAICGASSA
jgi:hypothetical protein